MATFLIDAENSITALDSHQADFEGEIFASQTELADLAAKGELTLRVAETVPLERFRDAYMRLERGGLPGKIVLTP